MSAALDFAGKTALVTGAAGGIGRASAIAFANHGATVLVCDVNDDGGHETVELIRSGGGTAFYQRVDVTREDEVRESIAVAVERFGDLHYAHNNAGIAGLAARVADSPLDAWQKVLDVNLTGIFLCMKYEIQHMQSRPGGGAIVNTSSISGLGASPMMSAYTASKHGVTGLTRVAGWDYAKRGIRINAICPGVTRTPMMDSWIGGDPLVEAVMDASVPIGRMAQPAEMAEAVVWLCSERASFVTGTTLAVDGGLTAWAGGGASDEEAAVSSVS